MKKTRALFCIVLFCLFLAGCGKNSAPNESQLKSMVPNELLHYTLYDWVQYHIDLDQPQSAYIKEVTSTVKSLKINRRQTNNKSDYAECEVKLTDAYLERTVTIAMYLNYYDQGGWFLDSWNIISAEAPTANNSYDLNTLKQYLAAQGYASASDVTVEKGADFLHYVGNLSSGSFPNLRISGQVDARVYLEQEADGYSWNANYEPDMKTEWNILGSWYGEPHSFSYSGWDGLTIWPRRNYLYVNITGLDSNTISGTIEHQWDADGGGIGTYNLQTNNNVTYSIEKTGPEVQSVRLVVTFNAGYNSFDLAFGPDKAYIRFRYAFGSMPPESTSFGEEWAELIRW